MKHTKRTLSLLLALLCLLSLVGCATPQGEPYPSDPPYFETTPTPTKKEITITPDNWNTYFEFIEKETEYINEYNEVEHIQHYYSFVLKNDYVMSENGTNIALEYSFNETRYYVHEDLSNKKIIWGDPIENTTQTVTEETTIKFAETKLAGDVFLIWGDKKYQCTDFKVLRIYGTLAIME